MPDVKPKLHTSEGLFEGWKIGTVMPSIKGPFRVRVYEVPTSGSKTKWKAMLLPTEQKFSGINTKTRQEAEDNIKAMFTKCIEPFRETWS